MSTAKPTFTIFTLTLLLLLGFFLSNMASEPVTGDDDDDDLEGLEELLALDEEEEEQEGSRVKSSEADVLSKAQRIVLEFSNENAKRIIDDNEYVLVLGYAPWCPRSAELMPRFAEAAMALKEMGSPLLLAKLDAERYPKSASLLGIKGFPTLLLFVNGSSQVYNGGFSKEEIVIWARKKTGAPVIKLTSISEAEEFLKKHQMFVVGLFEKFEGSEYEEFVNAASADNEIQFVETSNTEVAKVLFPDINSSNRFLGLVKSEPERYSIFEDTFGKDKILQFLEYNKFPLVNILTELNSIRVYSSPIKLQVFIFAEADDFNNLLVPLQDVARKFKSKIMFTYIDIAEDDLAKPFLTLFGLEESEKTLVTAFDNRISSKFLLELDPTPINVEEFCSGLLHGTLSPYFKSETIPDNGGRTVHTIVGRTFKDLVLSSPQSILLEIDDYPTLLFYPSSDKSNPIKLPTKSSLKELAAFINKNVRAGEDRGIQINDQATKDEL
ncbi:hypothetical protein HHK36_021621 [Tetracentron sinense]|uniref:protein disulfide-isomerase n=1 Tax=Tetracentron sinense TaxID=13715 RepID=A0A835D787_TETSI|nr:hypothetical protein HHK36_021621 [Tetracentron sinense]